MHNYAKCCFGQHDNIHCTINYTTEAAPPMFVSCSTWLVYIYNTPAWIGTPQVKQYISLNDEIYNGWLNLCYAVVSLQIQEIAA